MSADGEIVLDSKEDHYLKLAFQILTVPLVISAFALVIMVKFRGPGIYIAAAAFLIIAFVMFVLVYLVHRRMKHRNETDLIDLSA